MVEGWVIERWLHNCEILIGRRQTLLHRQVKSLTKPIDTNCHAEYLFFLQFYLVVTVELIFTKV